MEATLNSSTPWEGAYERHAVYAPAKSPGFVAWVTAFSYGNGEVGLSFDEIVEEENPGYTAPKLEYSETVSIPVSYGSVECGSAAQRSYRVYMKTSDGETFTETGRCPRKEGSFCNVGFPNGRILGYDVPKMNEDFTAKADFIRVRESCDGGNTWQDVRLLLKGTAPYLWRVRRLRSGTIVLLACLYGTPWGNGQERATRNTMLPGETYESKIQTFFMTSEDGISYTGPHYILPGIGAHEFDFAEMPDGRLLFIAGDVQGTPVGRQFVAPSPDGWINDTMYPIHQGAPKAPRQNPQGGYVPETVVWDEHSGCLVGYRRNKCFSISNDMGENWVDLVPKVAVNFLYQPFLLSLEGKWMELYGHVGGDAAFGQNEMYIEAQRLCINSAENLPKTPSLAIERVLAEDGSHYLNAFRARLTLGGKPLAGRRLVFRFTPYWNEDGSVSTVLQTSAPYQVETATGEDGTAEARADMFDGRGDVYLSYNADVVCPAGRGLREAASPTMVVLALTPWRRCLFPHDAYFAEGALFLAPQFAEAFPADMETLYKLDGGQSRLPAEVLSTAACKRLEDAGVLVRGDDGELYWLKSVHASSPLKEVKIMASGDWYE